MEKINIIDENGNIQGEEYRDVVHQKGLLHAEVHVWCVTPEHEVIFQHRAPNKETFPDLLDATAGGHVDLGETYEQAAVKELDEETGLKADASELVFLKSHLLKSHDPVTGLTNNCLRNVYLYKKLVDVSSLELEEGKAIGFESFSFDTLSSLSEEEKQKFIPDILDQDGLELFNQIKIECEDI